MILLNTKRKKISKYFFFFVCVLFIFSVQNVYASPSSFIYGITTGTGGMFAGLGGMFLDSAITNLVLQMGHLFINKGLGAVVTSVWTMIRDLFNILFIFSLVYIGLRTIYDADDSRTKKLLGSLIAAALLINFSLYIAKVVVDIANFTAVEIYKMAAGGISGTYGIKDVITLNTGSLAGAYMEVLNISSWFTTDEGVILDSGNAIIFGIFAMLFLMFMGFVLAYGALMLLVRFIAIVFYLMFSPLMFLGWILPQFKSYSTKWWKGFLGYSFFAPAYIFMLYVGLYALAQIKTEFGTDATFGGFFTSDEKTVSTFSIFLMFIIGTGFLYGATKVASTMSQGGAAIGMNMADKWSRKFTTNMGAAGAGRIISGGMGMYHKRNIDAIDAADAERGHTTAWSRTRRAWAEKGLNKKYGSPTSRKERDDTRKTANARASRGHAVNTLRNTLDAGGPDVATALQNATNAQLEQLAQSQRGRELLITHAEHLSKDKVKTLINSKEEGITDEFRTELADIHRITTDNRLISNLGGTPDDPTSEITNLRKANKEQLESIGVERLSLPANASRLTKKQIDFLEELKNDGKIEDAEFNTIRNTRNETLIDVANETPIAGAPTRDDMLNNVDAIPDLPENALIGLAPDLSKASLRKIAEKSENSKQIAVRRALIGSRSPVRPPINPETGRMIESGDPEWTPQHDIWEFLFRDNIGKNLGT